MKTLRILALTSLVAGFGLMTGCDSTSSGEAPVIKSLYVGDHETDLATFEFQANNTYRMVGTVENVSSWAWTIQNSTGATVETLTADAPNGSGTTDLGLGTAKRVQFTPKSSWGASGTYTIKGVLTGTDGSTLTKSFSIKAATGGSTGTAVSSKSLTLGSNNNSNGGSLDADAMVNYKLSEVTTTAMQGDIDLYYGYSSTNSKDRFFTPAQAKASSFNGIKDWTNIASIEIYDLGTMTQTAFDALATQEAIDALFTGKTKETDGSVDAAANVVVGIKTSKGAMRVIHVDAITGGASGTVTVKGYK